MKFYIFIFYRGDRVFQHIVVIGDKQRNDGIAGILGEAGLSEPVYAASNVSTGAGVIAADAPYIVKLPIASLLEEHGLDVK